MATKKTKPAAHCAPPAPECKHSRIKLCLDCAKVYCLKCKAEWAPSTPETKWDLRPWTNPPFTYTNVAGTVIPSSGFATLGDRVEPPSPTNGHVH